MTKNDEKCPSMCCGCPFAGECQDVDPQLKCSNDQPPPIPNDNEPLWPQLMEVVKNHFPGGPVMDRFLALAKERHEVGTKRYGTPLQAWNGRDFMEDAAQELMDAAVYLFGALKERDRVDDEDYFDPINDALSHIFTSISIVLSETLPTTENKDE